MMTRNLIICLFLVIKIVVSSKFSFSKNILRFGNKVYNSIPTLAVTISSVFLTESSILPVSAAPIEISQNDEIINPTDQENALVNMAFRDFDNRRFQQSEKEFSESIIRWKQMNRPRDEIVSLLKARANVFLDDKKFSLALLDQEEALTLMSDGENADGTAKYPEYVDTFVGRGLSKEGLADWSGALADYNKAITLWGGGRSDSINPYVLTFRGNVLCRLNRYEDAIPDYEAASNIFNSQRDIPRYSDSRANLALALYEVDRHDEAVKIMNDVIRKSPGYTDMHVAIAADAWANGDYITALKEWRYACDKISSGCLPYQDKDWVKNIRRWPSKLIVNLDSFLSRTIPQKLLGDQNSALVKLK